MLLLCKHKVSNQPCVYFVYLEGGSVLSGIRDSTVSSSLSGSTNTLKSQSELKEEELEETSTLTQSTHQSSEEPSSVKLQEPDVIASTKANSNTTISNSSNINTVADSAPVAPPRKKKKGKPQVPPSTLPVGKESVPIVSKVSRFLTKYVFFIFLGE